MAKSDDSEAQPLARRHGGAAAERYNNFGNIKSGGKDEWAGVVSAKHFDGGNYPTFGKPRDGVRAGIINFHTKVYRDHHDTAHSLIYGKGGNTGWTAKPTRGYVNSVLSQAQMQDGQKFDFSNLDQVVGAAKAIEKEEAGYYWVKDEDLVNGIYDAYQHINTDAKRRLWQGAVPEGGYKFTREQIAQAVAKKTGRPPVVVSKDAPAEAATQSPPNPEQARKALTEEGLQEVFREPSKAMEKLDFNDPEAIAAANGYAKRMQAYAKSKGVTMEDKALPEDGPSEQQKKDFFGELDKTAKTLMEQGKADKDAPLYRPDGDSTSTIGSAQQQADKDAATASAARAGEDRDRQDHQQRNDFANMGLGTDDMFLLALLLMAFGRGDLARQLMGAMGDPGGASRGSGGASARSYRQFDRNSPDSYGNVKTFTPGVRPEPKLFNFTHKDGSPLLQLPANGKITAIERQSDTDRFVLDGIAKVVAPANATIKAIDGKNITLAWQQNGKTFSAVISGLESVRERLQVGQVINRGDELGAAKGNVSLQVLRDGVALAPLYAGVDRTKPETLSFDLSKKEYDRREFEENNRLEKGYNSDRKTDVIISGKDERHHPFDGNSGLPESSGNLRNRTRSNDEVRRLPLFEMPDAVKEAAAKSPNGWVQTHVVDEWDNTRYVGRYIFYNKNATAYLADVGEGKKYKNADEAMHAAMRDGHIKVHATSGGGNGIEKRIKGRTPFTVQEDSHPDPDILAVAKTGVVRPLGTAPSIIGEEIFFPRTKYGDARDGFMTHRETRGGAIGSNGCLTVDWATYRNEKAQLGLHHNEVIMLHPDVARRGPTRYKEIDPDYTATAMPRGERATNQVATNKVIVAPDAHITYSPGSYWASLDSQGRLIAGNNPMARSDPASTMKMGTLYVIAKGLKDGRHPANPNDPLSSVNVAPEFMNQVVEYTDKYGHHKHTVAEALPHIMRVSSNEGSRAVAAAFARASKLVTPSADDHTAILAFNKHATNVFSSIGMNSTVMGDPAGDPDIRQPTYSTARDLAVLARRMATDFPNEAKYALARNSATGAANITQYDMDIGKTGTGGEGAGHSAHGAKSLVGASFDGVSFAVTNSTRGEWMSLAKKAAEAADKGRNAPPLSDAEKGVVRPAPTTRADAGQGVPGRDVPVRSVQVEIPGGLRMHGRDKSYTIRLQQGAEKFITHDSSKPSSAVLDKNGALVGGNNPFDPAMPASVTKVAIVLTGYDMEKKGEIPAGFMAKNARTITHFLAHSNDAQANEFARELARAAGHRDDKQQAFCNRMNRMFVERGMTATHINGTPSGGGASNAYDMAQMVYQLNHDYPEAKALYRVENDQWIGRNLGDDAKVLRKAGAPEVGKVGALAIGNGRISALGGRENKGRGPTAYSWVSGSGNSTLAVTEARRGELAEAVQKAGQLALRANDGIGLPPAPQRQEQLPPVAPPPPPAVAPAKPVVPSAEEEPPTRSVFSAPKPAPLPAASRSIDTISAPTKLIQKVRVFDAGHGPIPDQEKDEHGHKSHMNKGGGTSNELTEYQANLLQMFAEGVESLKRGVQPVYTNVAPAVMARMIQEGRALPPGITEKDIYANPRALTFKSTMAKIERAMEHYVGKDERGRDVASFPPDRFEHRLERARQLQEGKYPGLEGLKFNVLTYVSDHHDHSDKADQKGFTAAVHQEASERTWVFGRAFAETAMQPGSPEVANDHGDEYFKAFAKKLDAHQREKFGPYLKAHNTSVIQPIPYRVPDDAPENKRKYNNVSRGLGAIPEEGLPEIPGVLVENGFATNKEDRDKIADPEFRKRRAANKIKALEQAEHLVYDLGIDTIEKYENYQRQQGQKLERRSSVDEPQDKDNKDALRKQLASIDLLWMGQLASLDAEKRRVDAAEKENLAKAGDQKKGVDTIDGALAKVTSLDSAKGKISGGNDVKPDESQAKPSVPNTKVAENTKDQKSAGGASATV